MQQDNFIRYRAGYELGSLSYQVLNFDDFKDSLDLSEPGRTTYGRNHMEYSYRSWFQENHRSAWDDSDSNQAVPFQYDKLLVIDLLDGNRSWLDAFNNAEFFPRLIENMHDIFYQVSNELWERGSDEAYYALLYHKSITDDTAEIHALDNLRPRHISYRGYGGEVHPLMATINRVFNVSAWEFPEGVKFDRTKDDYLRNKIHTATEAVNQWKDFPMRYFAIPIPSDTYLGYLSDRSDEVEMGLSDYMWGDNNGRLWQTTMSQSYYQQDLHHHARWYDYGNKLWKQREYDWGGRSVRECSCCRKMYSTHFLTWYKTMGGYDNNTRNRICFFCNTYHTTSYNTNKKAFVVYPREVTLDNEAAFSQIASDYYVNYIHGKDSPNARGSREYMVKFIDDENYQDEAAFAGANDVNVTELEVDARKYLTWMYHTFATVPGDVKSQVVTDLREFLILDDESGAGSRNQANTGGYVDEEPISGVQQARLHGLGLPNAYIYASDNPLAEIIISLRIDYMGDYREFYYRSSRQVTQERVSDGWIEPPGIGLELNTDKNDYGWSPRWHYVDYRAGKYYNYPADAPSINVHARDACDCADDMCREDNRVHPSRHEWHHTRGVSLGLELELIGRDSRLLDEVQWLQLFERTVQVFHPEGLEDLIGGGINTQLIHAKRDGSLPSDSGVEYVSQPMTLNAWHAVPDKFWKFVEANYKAFNQTDVGIHIHFPWASMEVGHAYAMLSALNSLQINRHGILYAVAQRGDGQYSRWDLLTFRDAYNVVAEVAKQRTRSDNDKYKSINLQHEQTVELRYFQSNAKGNRILKNLEFVDALYEMTKRDYQMSRGWNHNEDVPTDSLIEVVTEYGNQSTKYKIESIHPAEVPFANYIEKKLYEYILEREQRYPNLVEFLADSLTEDEDEDSEITLEDIGYWEEIPEDDTELVLPSAMINSTFVFESEHITVDGTTYTNTNT